MNRKSQKSSVDILDQLYHSLYYHQVKKDWQEVDNVLDEIKRIEEDPQYLREETLGPNGVTEYSEDRV